jgi:hypothetical protein
VLTIDEYASIPKIEAYSMDVHEWSTDYAIISVEVDEIKVDLIFYPTDINGHFRPIAYFGSAPNTAQL